MLSLAKFATRAGRSGRPLDDPFVVFSLNDVHFRYGGTSMIAGKPGSFKSVFALNLLRYWVTVANKTALYISVDSDEFTVTKRIASICTGRNQLKQVEPDFLQERFDAYLPELEKFKYVRFEYERLDVDEIAERLAAWESVYGDYPDLVFIDNLVNLASHPQDWDGMGTIINEFDAIARRTGSHFCVLHHASESREWGRPIDPVPVAAVQGKLTQIPRLVLTVAANDKCLMVTTGKNTNGPSDPGALHPMVFQVQDSLAVIDDYRREM